MAAIAMHRALIYRNHGKYQQVLNIETEPRPVPTRPGDVVVRVMACALSAGDIRITEGDAAMISPVPLPGHVGFDFAGIVEELSEEAAREGRIAKGDEVFGSARGLRSGSVAEYFAVDGSVLSKKPKNISFIQAAAVPVGAQTAFQALRDAGLKPYPVDDPAQPEDISVLVTAGAGGVGTYVIQLAKHVFRANRIVTTASASKAELLTKIGADEVVDYHKEPIAQHLQKKQNEGRGENFNAIIDITTETSSLIPFLKPKVGGIINVSGYITRKALNIWMVNTRSQGYSFSNAIEGFVTYFPWTFDLISGTTLAQYRASKYGSHFGSIMTSPNYEDLDVIASYLAAGKFEPVIDSVHPFEDWRAAFERVQSGRATGRVVLDLSPKEVSST